MIDFYPLFMQLHSYSVRPLRRVVEQQIRDKVTDFHLDNLDAKHLEADMEDGVLVIKEKDAK